MAPRSCLLVFWLYFWLLSCLAVSANSAQSIRMVVAEDVGIRAKCPCNGESPSIQIEQDFDALWINTGPLRFSIARNRFGIFEEAFLDKNRDGVFELNEALVATRFFSQQFPKALTTSRDGLRIALYPAEAEKSKTSSGSLQNSSPPRTGSMLTICRPVKRIFTFAMTS
jgi:hypothetical protein